MGDFPPTAAGFTKTMIRCCLAPLVALALAGCDRSTDEAEAGFSSPRPRTAAGLPPSREARETGAPSARRTIETLERIPADERVDRYVDALLLLDDGEMDLALDAVDRVNDAGQQLELLGGLAEMLAGRPELVRWPMLLSITRHPAADAGLRATVLGQLRRELGSDHGESIDGWMRAIESRLEEDGAVRVE